MNNEQIIISSLHGFILVSKSDITHCHANGRQTIIYMQGGDSHLSYEHLKIWEERLGSDFIRVHDSYLISRHHVVQYIGGKAKVALMKDKTSIPIARRRAYLILEAFKTKA